MSNNILVCRESAVVKVDGERYVFTRGVTRVRDGHPLLDRFGEYFEPIAVHYDLPDVETTREEPVPSKRAASKRAASD